MSEKELRDAHISSNMYGDKCELCGAVCGDYGQADDIEHGPDCPLAAAPDVVKLAQKLAQLMRQYQDDLDVSKKPHYTIEEVGIRGYKMGVVSTLRETIGLTANLFHVRLTDDGYEWTDER